MFNRDYKTGKNVRAARRLAGILMAGTLAGTLAVGNAPAVFVSAATWQENANYIFDYLTQRLHYSEAAACNMVMNVTPRGSTYISEICATSEFMG